MRLFAAIGAFIIALALNATPGKATVLYQSIPDLSASRSDSLCSNCPDIGPVQSIGQIFSFGASATAKSLSFVVSNDYVWPTSVTVGIYEDAGGAVGANIYRQTFTTFASDVPTAGLTDVLSVNLGTGLTLGSGSYIVFLTNSSGLGVATFGGGPGNAIYNYDSTFPDLTGNPYASLPGQDIGVLFSSTSAIPEPATWTMLLVGFAGIGFFARRRKPALTFQLT